MTTTSTSVPQWRPGHSREEPRHTGQEVQRAQESAGRDRSRPHSSPVQCRPPCFPAAPPLLDLAQLTKGTRKSPGNRPDSKALTTPCACTQCKAGMVPTQDRDWPIPHTCPPTPLSQHPCQKPQPRAHHTTAGASRLSDIGTVAPLPPNPPPQWCSLRSSFSVTQHSSL